MDETNGSVTLSWGPGAARLGSNTEHYEVAIPDATNPSTALYSNLNVDDSTTPTTLTISNARALGLEGSHTAEVRHCNAAGGCSLPLNITFMVTPSIALLGVGASLEVDAADQFSVSVRRLNPSHNYLIRVVYTTSHIAEDSGCLGGSTNTIRNFSGSTTFYLSTFNVYGCSAGDVDNNCQSAPRHKRSGASLVSCHCRCSGFCHHTQPTGRSNRLDWRRRRQGHQLELACPIGGALVKSCGNSLPG